MVGLTIAFGVLLVAGIGKAQIPTPCANAANFASRECCPTPTNVSANAGPCGSNLSRGECVNVPNPYGDMVNRGDARQNWPRFYFTQICNCSSKYGGYDCGECAFGYRGPNCDQKYIRQRRSTSDLSNQEWNTYIDQLRRAKQSNTSRYRVITSPPDYDNPAAIQTVPIGVYDLFAWFHHYVAKDNDDGGPDYAHEATGFPTWHRLFLLWFEREMQHFLNDDNFTVHYWDWRDPDQRTSLFESNRLGAHHPQNSTVTGDLVNGWRTICWYNGSGGVSRPSANQNICDPRNDTGPIQRCPDKERCAANYTGWPTYQDVQDAVNMTQYDMPDYNAFSTGFRNYMEGFLVVGQCDNETDRGRDLCNNKIIDGTKEKVQRLLHNTIHLILGIGRFNNKFINTQKGVMGDVAASANDPIFINHHTMIDCILEEWLKRTANYPASENINMGHRQNDYIVPFIPLYTHNMMFKRAEDFGYLCNIPDAAPTTAPTTQSRSTTQPRSTTATTASAQSTTALHLLILAIIGIVTLIL